MMRVSLRPPVDAQPAPTCSTCQGAGAAPTRSTAEQTSKPTSENIELEHEDVDCVHTSEHDELLNSIDGPTRMFLKEHPVKIRLVRDLPTSPGNGFRGVYVPADQDSSALLTVNTYREPNDWGVPFVPGKIERMSASGMTELDSAEISLRHEIGHHLHMMDGAGSAVDDIVMSACQSGNARPMTGNGTDDCREYFADAYAAYYYQHDALKTSDPVGYKMVQDVLRARGIPGK